MSRVASRIAPHAGKASLGFLLLLGTLTAFPPVSSDMYLPALPTMARDLGASAAQGPLTVSALFLGISIGQLFYGPLSDRLGRRPPLLFGIALYVGASIACAFAPTIGALIGFRFLQGLGGCAALVVARAVVRDCYDPQETAKVYSLLTLVMGMGPVVSPFFGGLILNVAGWRTIFWVLTAFGVIAGLASLIFLAETRPEEVARRAHGESPLASYWALLRERRVLGYVLCGALSQAALFTYVSTSPNLIIDTYHVPAEYFGLLFGANGVGLVTCSLLNRWVLKNHAYDPILRRSNLFGIVIAAGFVAIGISGFGGLIGVCVPLFLLVANMGFTQANALAGAMSIDPSRAGSASALVGSGQFFLGSLAGWIAASLHDGSALPMAGVIFVSLVIAGVALRTLARPPREA